MLALVFQGSRVQIRRDYPHPVPQPGEALIHIHLAGICNTDREAVLVEPLAAAFQVLEAGPGL